MDQRPLRWGAIKHLVPKAFEALEGVSLNRFSMFQETRASSILHDRRAIGKQSKENVSSLSQ